MPVVLVRFLLMLLLAALATPAAAMEPACHDDTATMAAMAGMHHEAPAARDKAAPHLCAGCVPLADWLGERVAAPMVPVAVEPVARIATLGPGRPPVPMLRPPRRG